MVCISNCRSNVSRKSVPANIRAKLTSALLATIYNAPWCMPHLFNTGLIFPLLCIGRIDARPRLPQSDICCAE